WTQRAKLTASDGGAEDQFGELVLRGDTALIGAPGHAGNRGAAYVFVGSGSSWSEQAKLEASDGRADDYFGARVGLDGDRALIGAFSHDDAGVIESGAAYVFVRSGTAWSQEAKLVPSDVATEDEFGRAVALAGDTVMVSSFHDDDLGLDSGSAYVFRRDGSTWSEEAKLTSAPNGEADAFGSSVTIAGDL
ncbi:MAG: FG-GAP repeat protein, partial [Xanthomonadales bacterium]|nr:FG-GAP repeat protein [Xanthomonadales bacterium]